MKLNQWLLERFRLGETVVLILDEAQNRAFPVVEEIRLFDQSGVYFGEASADCAFRTVRA